jgi:transposase
MIETNVLDEIERESRIRQRLETISPRNLICIWLVYNGWTREQVGELFGVSREAIRLWIMEEME